MLSCCTAGLVVEERLVVEEKLVAEVLSCSGGVEKLVVEVLSCSGGVEKLVVVHAEALSCCREVGTAEGLSCCREVGIAACWCTRYLDMLQSDGFLAGVEQSFVKNESTATAKHAFH